MSQTSCTSARLRPEVAIGPGKIELLGLVAETVSIAAAGRRMGMSYKRALQLVEEMNGWFREPLAETARGGAVGGGAVLTALGIEILQHCRNMQRDQREWRNYRARRSLTIFLR